MAPIDLHPEHEIGPGIRGWLESPASAVIASDCLAVAGWAFVRGHQIVDVWSTGFGARRPLQCGIRRDDVAAIYPDDPTALQSGFTGYVELDGGNGERLNFDIWARLDDGRAIRLYQRTLLTRAPGMKSGLRSALQQLSRPSILLSRRTWIDGLRIVRSLWSPPSVRPVASASGKAGLRRSTRTALADFIEGGLRLTFVPSSPAVVSVVVVVWNHADLTLTCLRALAEQRDVPMDVVVVDNASTDETIELLGRLDGVTVIRNSSNLGFTMALNIGARVSRGEFLLFVNNDAALAPGSIKQLVESARRSNTIGAVGGKLVYTDGTLQEAGSIIWADGSCEGYGRGGDPSAPEFNFERPVDFCSAALLLARRSLFEQLGGFDERYRPAYYDDADYCVRVWASGHRVIYQPGAAATHYEFGSTSPEASMELQIGRRPIFVATHRRWLAAQMSSESASRLEARSHPHAAPAVLIIDDAAPDPRIGSGFPRAAALTQALFELNYLVTLYTTNGRPAPRSALHPWLEIIPGNPAGLHDFIASRRHYDLVIVSRPHNMQYLKAAVGSDLSGLGVPCVYDAEALYALREIGRRKLAGQPMTDADTQTLIDAETGLMRGCAAVLTVSDRERQLFAAVPAKGTAALRAHVHVVGHAVELQPTPNTFVARRSILFVGAFSSQSSNEDAVLYLCREVIPALRAAWHCDPPIIVAGANLPERLKELGDAAVTWHADVDDLAPFYDNARVFVAPTRYAAGISLKVIEAAAHGVPVVCTRLVADQLGWESGVELLAADGPEELAAAVASLYNDADLWVRVRTAALKRVADDYSAAKFRSALQNSLRTSPEAEERSGRSQPRSLRTGAAAGD